jgi:hypothetical protein
MTNCIADRSQVKNVIRNQQRKLSEEMKQIVNQKATQSRYSALSRSEKRVTEFHHDRLTQEQSLQKDCKKAERLARRISQILERLRKEFNKIKNHLGDYNFTNTVGMDSSCGGASSDDLSTDIGTRQAWKRELNNMLTMSWHYVDAQHLGDYALNHQPEHPNEYDATCNSSASNPLSNSCPKVYRPTFHYYTPDGDCLAMPADAGSHSGDSTQVGSTTESYNLDGTLNTNTNNYNGAANIRSCVLGYKSGTFKPGQSDSTQEYKAPSASLKSFQITNKDLEIRQLWRLLAAPEGSAEKSAAWWNFLYANAYHYQQTNLSNVAMWRTGTSVEENAANAVFLATHFQNTLCLPIQMMERLNDIIAFDNGVSGAITLKISVLYRLVVKIQNRDPVFPTTQLVSGAKSGAGGNAWSADHYTIEHSESGGIDSSAVTGSVLSSVPNICNVEDESDLQFIFKLITCVMNNVRSCQVNNDREQEVIDFVNEVSECNEAFHQDVFTDMTAIDESELGQRYVVGKELCMDLDGLYKENCCSKQNFFNDATLTNMSW